VVLCAARTVDGGRSSEMTARFPYATAQRRDVMPFVGNVEICALDVGLDVSSLRGGII
jgi:hypothetical protein